MSPGEQVENMSNQMKQAILYLALLIPACIPSLACTHANDALQSADDAKAKLDALTAQVEQAAAKAKAAQAEATARCESALQTLKEVEAVAPFACGLVDAFPESDASKLPKATCAKRDLLPAAVQNVEKACGLIADAL